MLGVDSFTMTLKVNGYDSYNDQMLEQTIRIRGKTSSSFLKWLIPVLITVVILFVVGIWCIKKEAKT